MRWTCLLLILTVSFLAGCGGDESEHAVSPEQAQSAASQPETGSDVVQASATEPGDSEQSANPSIPVVTAEQVLEQVDLLVSERQFNRALSVLNQLIEQKPDVPEAYLKRAAIYAEAKLYSRAIADMTSAIQLLPQNARLRNTRGYFYLSQNDLDRAMADFDDAIGLDLEYEQPFNNRGLVRIAREDFEGALLDFNAALTIEPDYLDALNNRGFALMRLDRNEEAIENFTSVIDKNDKYVNAWNNRGLALAALERHEEAIADFTRAIELQPSNLKYYLHRSAAHEALGHTEEAQADQFTVAWFQRLAEHNNIIGRNQHNPNSWIARGRHLTAGLRYDDAIADFNRALTEDPDCADAHVAMAELLLIQDPPNVELAIAELTKAIECGPSYTAHSMRGDVYFQQGDFESAIADYEAARRIDSQVAQAYRGRSEQLSESGDVEQASALMQRATQIEEHIHANEQAPEAAAQDATAQDDAAGTDDEPAQSAAADDATTTQ